MKTKAWALTALLAALPAVPVHGGVFYSPVFNMPLQPAPSPCDGGFYWVLPDGSLYGPNYDLVPPFNPVSGFNNVLLGQRLFANMHEACIKGEQSKGGAPPPAKQIGIGGYTLDYSDPNTMKNFDATAPMINGYTPFGPNFQPPPQTYGNGPMPTPRYANYPNFQAPFVGSGGGYPANGMMSQAPANEVYQAAYFRPGDCNSNYYYYGPYYYGPSYGTCYHGPAYSEYYGYGNYAVGYGGGGYWGNGGASYAAPAQDGIRLVQAVAPSCPPAMNGYGNTYNPGYTNLPCPPMPGSYSPGYTNLPYVPAMQTPYYPAPMTPTFGMQYYQTPMNPSYSMPNYRTPNYSMPQVCFPNLPNPSYAPPPCPDNQNQPRYFTNSMVRSPRDYFMWTEVQEDRAARARKPLTVPQ